MFRILNERGYVYVDEDEIDNLIATFEAHVHDLMIFSRKHVTSSSCVRA